MIDRPEKIYFVSDAHLGSALESDTRAHEKKLTDWLEMAGKDATRIYLLGDIFDFWYEYETVVPKGFVRFFGKVASLIDKGIEVHFFTGNHDIWAFSYFEKEVGMIVHKKPVTVTFFDQKFFLAHGDGLDSQDKGFRFISKIFHHPFAQRLFSYVPPRLGQKMGFAWSRKSRMHILQQDNSFKGEDNEELVRFSKKYIQENPVDYLIFGHRHLDMMLQISKQSRMVILGDFVSIFSYGVLDKDGFRLEYF